MQGMQLAPNVIALIALIGNLLYSGAHCKAVTNKGGKTLQATEGSCSVLASCDQCIKSVGSSLLRGEYGCNWHVDMGECHSKGGSTAKSNPGALVGCGLFPSTPSSCTLLQMATKGSLCYKQFEATLFSTCWAAVPASLVFSNYMDACVAMKWNSLNSEATATNAQGGTKGVTQYTIDPNEDRLLTPAEYDGTLPADSVIGFCRRLAAREVGLMTDFEESSGWVLNHVVSTFADPGKGMAGSNNGQPQIYAPYDRTKSPEENELAQFPYGVFAGTWDVVPDIKALIKREKVILEGDPIPPPNEYKGDEVYAVFVVSRQRVAERFKTKILCDQEVIDVLD